MAHPLHGRDFRLLFAARTLSMTGDAAVPAALALAVLRTTGSTSALALVLGCAMVPRLLLLPIGGVVADRFNARTVALVTDLVGCAAQLFAGLELLSGRAELWHLAVAQVIGGTASAFQAPTISPLVAGTVEAPGLHKANSVLGTTNGATRLIGPALAGTFVLTIGPGWTFVLDSASFALSGALLAATRVRHVPIPHRSLRADLAEGWSEVRSRDWYWTSLIAHSVWNGASAVLLTLGPALAVERLGGEGAWIATVQVGAVGLVMGALLATRVHPRRPVLVANAGLAVFAVPLALLAVAAPAPLVIGTYGLALIGLGLLNPLWETVVQLTVPQQALARVTSYDWLLSLAAAPVAYALAPWAASAWGSSTPLMIAACLVAVSCLGTIAVPSVRNLQMPTTPPPTQPTPARPPHNPVPAPAPARTPHNPAPAP
ncbi:MFS transporter [Actinomadura sp. NEAU-AAG7]|uniref:MFS transporter n=1 Tax=Actinomadura sp. NEAU-AAG7 TaxID=2839640 RepID=UPI001BE40C66|nr:MFS transporter [Actinomadura sp. NEAU-AAG7]MBT2206835.1 MFS transporter [Actinomadura sp. NEAU-AAG7]